MHRNAAPMLEAYRHISRFRIPFSDIDMMGHVNHRAYIEWVEATRSNYFVEVLGETVNGERGLILVRVDFAYEKQLNFRENVAVGTRISRFGTRSFDFAYEVWSEDGGVRVASGSTTMVAYDYTTSSSIIVPASWREKTLAFEITQPD